MPVAPTIITSGAPGLFDDIIHGTCELSQAYGVVESGEVKMTGDTEKIKGCDGRTSALLLIDPGYQYTFEALFAASADLPQKGDPVAFPDAWETGIVGTCVDGSIKWQKGGQKMLSITCDHYKAIGNDPSVVTV